MKTISLLVLVVACGSGKAPPLTVGDVCDNLVEAVCQRQVQCGLMDELATCLSNGRDHCCADEGTCERVALNAYALEKCADDYSAGSCEQLAISSPESCR